MCEPLEVLTDKCNFKDKISAQGQGISSKG